MDSLVNRIYPFLNGIDSVLEGIMGPFGRVCFWGMISGVVGIALYGCVSNQARIRDYKANIQLLRGRLGRENLDANQALTLAFRNLQVSLGLLRVVTPSALLSTGPVIVVMLWSSTYYGYEKPLDGEQVKIISRPWVADIRIEMDGNKFSDSDGTFSIQCCADSGLALVAPDGLIYRGNPFRPPVPLVHKRQWWNLIIGNPAGYLEDDAAVAEVAFDVNPRKLSEGWPSWMSTWEFPFFGSLLVATLLLKYVYRLQ